MWNWIRSKLLTNTLLAELEQRMGQRLWDGIQATNQNAIAASNKCDAISAAIGKLPFDDLSTRLFHVEQWATEFSKSQFTMNQNLKETHELIQGFEQYEAISFSINKLLGDPSFASMDLAQARMEGARWAGYYLKEHGWENPGNDRLSSMAEARLRSVLIDQQEVKHGA